MCSSQVRYYLAIASSLPNRWLTRPHGTLVSSLFSSALSDVVVSGFVLLLDCIYYSDQCDSPPLDALRISSASYKSSSSGLCSTSSCPLDLSCACPGLKLTPKINRVLFIYYWPSRLKYAFVTPIDHSRSHTQTPHRSNASTPPSLSTRMIRLFWPSAADQIFVGESTPSVSRTSHQRTVSDSSASSVGLGSPGNSYYTSNPVLLPSMTHKSQVTWTAEYRHAIAVAILVGLHLVVSIFITFLLLILSPKYRENDPADPEHPGYPHNHSTKLMLSWATVLGLLAMCLAAVQYVPQLWHTWSTRLVGCQ